MPRTESQKTQIVRDYCRKWPKHGNLTLAKAIYKECPTVWPSVNSARCAVQRVRGSLGPKARKETTDKSLFQPPRKAGEPEIALPESVSQKRVPYKMSSLRNLVLSDIHMPYHDVDAVKLAVTEGIAFNADGVILNGDICDFFACSFWERDPKKVDLEKEIQTVKDFFEYLRVAFPNAEIVWKMGNHEERYERYLWKKAPELLSVSSFSMEAIFELSKYRIELVKNKRKIMSGKLTLLHGHEFPNGMTNPVNQARGQFVRGLECSMAGHGHRTSEHAETTLNGELITCWSTGCLCDLEPDYAPINKWNHGFALIENDDAGAFEVTNKRIYKGRVW